MEVPCSFGSWGANLVKVRMAHICFELDDRISHSFTGEVSAQGKSKVI